MSPRSPAANTGNRHLAEVQRLLTTGKTNGPDTEESLRIVLRMAAAVVDQDQAIGRFFKAQRADKDTPGYGAELDLSASIASDAYIEYRNAKQALTGLELKATP